MDFVELCVDMEKHNNKLILCSLKSDLQIIYTKLYYWDFKEPQNIDIYDKSYNIIYNPQSFHSSSHNVIISNYQHDKLIKNACKVYVYDDMTETFSVKKNEKYLKNNDM